MGNYRFSPDYVQPTKIMWVMWLIGPLLGKKVGIISFYLVMYLSSNKLVTWILNVHLQENVFVLTHFKKKVFLFLFLFFFSRVWHFFFLSKEWFLFKSFVFLWKFYFVYSKFGICFPFEAPKRLKEKYKLFLI